MAKRTVAARWLLGLVLFVPAGVLIPSSALALGTRGEGAGDAYGRTLVALIVIGAACALAGMAAHVSAWVAAVGDVRRSGDRAWSAAVLWGGLAGILTTPLFGLGALVFSSVMSAYLVAGPAGVPPAKATITRWSDAGLAAVAAGGTLALVVANMTGPGRPLHGMLWPPLALVSLGVTAAVAGTIAVGAAWWAALYNARQLPDGLWYDRLLRGGVAAAVTMPLLGLGGVVLTMVMIAYRRGAPDGVPPVARPAADGGGGGDAGEGGDAGLGLRPAA